MKVYIIYDDTGRKSEVISDIVGEHGFADVVVKKRRLEEYFSEGIRDIYPEAIWKKIRSAYEYRDLIKELELKHAVSGDEIRIMHCFSNYLISDKREAGLSFEKLQFVEEPYVALERSRAVLVMFPDLQSYTNFCSSILAGEKAWDIAKKIKCSFEIKGMADIGQVENFIQCITGNFDSRYFNSLKVGGNNEYTLIKTSCNKRKIKSEYKFYHLLPEDMKYWFVMPFNYTETEEYASYTMERLHMTDLAIKWVHGSMDENEFGDLMDKYFFFFKSRHRKSCTEKEYQEMSDRLYVTKVNERIADLKRLPEYCRIEKFLDAAEEARIDKLTEKYFRLKEKIESKLHFPAECVIGHGDPCFANAMYNKSTKMLKFIDPKGALTEEELWTNPYYDLAKLSHSVCGRYDFFNNNLYDIRINHEFSYELEIPFDNAKYMNIFRKKVEENGFNYYAVRIYEASLFLSMLPLHIDNPHKVFGFLLNAKGILEEIEKDV